MRRSRGNAGATLVEVAVSVAILGLTITPVAGIYLKSMVIQAEGGHYLQALNIARGEVEKTVVAGFPGTVPLVSTYPYTPPGNVADWPDSGFTVTKGLYQRPGRTDLVDVVVGVGWTERSSSKNVKLQTSIGQKR